MAFTTIDNPELYFQVKTYTGNGGTLAITLDGSEDMSPNLVWIKERNLTSSHALTDTVRGTTKKLKSDDNDPEETNTNLITSFDSDGFTLGDNGNANQSSSQTYVAWCWVESATAGFDIVSYTGNATNRTISHNLSAVPHWILIKNLDSTSSGAEHWLVYHQGNDNTHAQLLNQTDAKIDDATYFQDTDPTSSVFSIGTADRCNKNSEDNIAYVWSEKQGFSSFGSYTGNGDNNGTFVFTGFSPAFIMIKRSDGTGQWGMNDTKRDFNDEYGNDTSVFADNHQVETSSGSLNVDFLSNGFKLRSDNNEYNNSGGSYVYMTFADSPFVNSNKIPNNARQ